MANLNQIAQNVNRIALDRYGYYLNFVRDTGNRLTPRPEFNRRGLWLKQIEAAAEFEGSGFFVLFSENAIWQTRFFEPDTIKLKNDVIEYNNVYYRVEAFQIVGRRQYLAMVTLVITLPAGAIIRDATELTNA